jgi:hypothetical protein
MQSIFFIIVVKPSHQKSKKSQNIRCVLLFTAQIIQVRYMLRYNNNNNNKDFLSQTRWGRLEMKPHMKTSELKPPKKRKGRQRQRRTEKRRNGKTHKKR